MPIGSAQKEKQGIKNAIAANTSGFNIYPPATYATDRENTYKNRKTAFAVEDQIDQNTVSSAIITYDENTTLPIPPIIRRKLQDSV